MALRTKAEDIFRIEWTKYGSKTRGFRKNFGWSEADVAEAEKRVKILPITAKRGKDFVNLLRRIQNKYHFDLVVINPLQGVSGIDLAKNNELSDFCRGGIDPIIKDDATKCGLLIVHHTVKPPSNADKVNFGKGAFAQYIGAGGQEINAWMRGMLLLMPTIEPGLYELAAVKRGERLEWTNPPGKKYLYPTKLIQHAPKEDRMLFWNEVGAVPESFQNLSTKQKRNPAMDAQELFERIAPQRRLVNCESWPARCLESSMVIASNLNLYITTRNTDLLCIKAQTTTSRFTGAQVCLTKPRRFSHYSRRLYI